MPKIMRTRKPMERWLALSPLVVGTLLMLMSGAATVRVHAATSSTDCAADGSTLYCRLTSILNILYIVAAVLGVVLIVIAVFAYLAYRRNRARGLQETDRR